MQPESDTSFLITISPEVVLAHMETLQGKGYSLTVMNQLAVSLGHPIGVSSARILSTLMYALRRSGKRRGIASLCIGGGGGIALAVELIR